MCNSSGYVWIRGHIKGAPIGTHSSSDIVFRASPIFEKFDLCAKRESMKRISLALVMMCGSVFAQISVEWQLDLADELDIDFQNYE